jgi:hypothetical protein
VLWPNEFGPTDDNGSLVVKGRLPPEQGALFIKDGPWIVSELCRDGHGDIRFRRPDGRAVPTAGAPRNIFGRGIRRAGAGLCYGHLITSRRAWTAKPCLCQQ